MVRSLLEVAGRPSCGSPTLARGEPSDQTPAVVARVGPQRLAGGGGPVTLGSMRSFSCPVCGARTFFENSVCLACGTPIGFDRPTGAMFSLAPDGATGVL